MQVTIALEGTPDHSGGKHDLNICGDAIGLCRAVVGSGSKAT
jgi:hypothetical protein